MTRKLHSIGTFLLVGSAICGLIAFERYRSAQKTAAAVADAIGDLQVVSVGIPIETIVGGFCATGFLIAGLKCMWDARQGDRAASL